MLSKKSDTAMVFDVSVRACVHKILLQRVTGGKVPDTSESNPRMHMGTPRMRTGREAGNFAYGESPFA
jgi:hypothetical protein